MTKLTNFLFNAIILIESNHLHPVMSPNQEYKNSDLIAIALGHWIDIG